MTDATFVILFLIGFVIVCVLGWKLFLILVRQFMAAVRKD